MARRSESNASRRTVIDIAVIGLSRLRKIERTIMRRISRLL